MSFINFEFYNSFESYPFKIHFKFCMLINKYDVYGLNYNKYGVKYSALRLFTWLPTINRNAK